MKAKKAVVVGGGPVGCMAAIRLRELGWEVSVFEAAPDRRSTRGGRRRSINLTLCERGLRTLPSGVRKVLYEHGVPCVHRVVHQADGTLVSLPYGVSPQQHLLSIPREVLSGLMLEQAERSGARMFFAHRCVEADPKRGNVTFVAESDATALHREIDVDLIVGCDGSNSAVRHHMSRRGARIDVTQRFLSHSYVEVTIPATGDHEYCWPPSLEPIHPTGSGPQYGLHAWPRREALLFAQPNLDKSYTASLFLPLATETSTQASFESLRDPRAMEQFFRINFPDALQHMDGPVDDVASAHPAPLRSIKCSTYHFERAVLLGDAAHTMVPFFGQGVNSGFEDVQELVGALRRVSGPQVPQQAVAEALRAYSDSRSVSGRAITDLSLYNFEELSKHSAERGFQARHRVERLLYERAPHAFQSLLSMISFSEHSYAEVLRRHERQRQALDRLCARFDVERQPEEIVEAYLSSHTASSLELEHAS